MFKRILVISLAGTLILMGVTAAFGQTPKKFAVRIASDSPPPPHAMALVMNWVRDEIQKRIPGSEGRTYFGGSLYTMNDAMTALQAGNLEIAASPLGKTTGFESWANILTMNMAYTSVGAIHHFPQTEFAKMLTDRYAGKGILLMGWGAMTHYFGIAAQKVFLTPKDIKGYKLRIMSPLTQGPTLKAWGASPVVMAWGDVPSAIQSKVIDGAITSTGGWASIRTQTPFFTIMGVGGLATDFFPFFVSKKWFNGLEPATQKVIKDILHEGMENNWIWQYCSDNLILQEFGTKDPAKPGVYMLNPKQVRAFQTALGDAVADNLISKLGNKAKSWVLKFREEGLKLSEKYPPETDPVEKIDCGPYRELLTFKKK